MHLVHFNLHVLKVLKTKLHFATIYPCIKWFQNEWFQQNITREVQLSMG